MDFLPLRIMSFMNFASTRSWNFGSGVIFRFGTSRRRGICLSSLAKLGGTLRRPLGAVLRAALLAAGDADRVERAADDVVADAGEVLDAAPADHDHRVLLQIVADAGDVAGHFHPVGQANAGDLAQRRVRLLGSGGVDARGP